MKYNQLSTNSTKNSTRVGRGISAGKGKTAGRGTKGQNARTGGGTRPGFEGGQNPLMQRLPKMRGFRSIRPETEVVYTGQLENLNTNIDNVSLHEAGLVSSPYTNVKIVVKGELTKKRNVSVQNASKSAIEMIQKAGGSYKTVSRLQEQKTDKKDNK